MKNKISRIVSAILAFVMIISLASCFDFGGDDALENKEFTVFSSDKTVNLITAVSATEAVIELRSSVLKALTKLGLTVECVLDIHSCEGYKIYLGDTSNAATASAKSKLDGQGLVEGDIGFVISAESEALAIYSNQDYGYEMASDAFLAGYTKSATLKLKSNHTEFGKMTKEEYDNMINNASWASRWDYTEKKYGEDITAALKRLYAFYGDKVYKWIANLYDTEHGGFYYANSARDYDGFLPDIESTTQALWLITASGLTKHLDNDLSVALPKDVVDKTLEFVYSLYDDSDGYFYHPQWGKNIGSTRKGRDIGSSIGVIEKLGGVVPENHALNRLENGETADAVSKVVAVSSVKAVSYLSSESELLAWLEKLDINHNSHGGGHTIESSAGMIKAAGYGQFVLDWLDSKQLESGLWEEVNPSNPYSALSGLLKIGSCYSKLGGHMKRCGDMVETAIDVILSDVNPYIVIYVYNPWGGLKYALSSIKAANAEARENGKAEPYDYDAEFDKVLAAFPEMIDVTIEKLELFQKSDGSFSYYQNMSAAYTQGTHVSLGKEEGDVNGTSLGMTTMYTTFYEILGIPVVPLYNEDDYNEFIEILTTLEPIEKLPRPEFATLDFEDGEMPVYISPYSTAAGSSMTVEDDGSDENMALHVISPSGVGDQVTFKADSSSEGMLSFAFDFDMRMDSSTAYSHQISLLDSQGSIATMMTVHVSGNTITFRDTTNNSYYTGAVYFNGASATIGEWFHVRMEYHVLDGDMRFVLYINEEYAGESDNFWGKLTESGEIREGVTHCLSIERLQIYTMMSANVDFWIDNLDYEFFVDSQYE